MRPGPGCDVQQGASAILNERPAPGLAIGAPNDDKWALSRSTITKASGAGSINIAKAEPA